MVASDLHFTDEREPQVENYRPLSGLAVLSLLFGLLSPLATASAYLLAMPLFAAAAALIALRRIHVSADDMSGRRLAVLALVLACFFGAWGVAQNLGRPWVVARQARTFSDDWLQLMVEGRVMEAFQWTLEPSGRVSPTIALDLFFASNEEADRSIENYFSSLPFAVDKRHSSLKSFRYIGNQSVSSDEHDDIVIHVYEIVHEKDGKPHTDYVFVSSQRAPSQDSKFVHWRLRDVRLTSTPLPGITG